MPLFTILKTKRGYLGNHPIRVLIRMKFLRVLICSNQTAGFDNSKKERKAKQTKFYDAKTLFSDYRYMSNRQCVSPTILLKIRLMEIMHTTSFL